MFRYLFIAIPGLVLGAFLWWAFSPLLFDTVVNEALVVEANDELVSIGIFHGKDAAHQASGNARLIEKAGGGFEIHFALFQVTNGPDLKVYISDKAQPKTATEVLESSWVNVGQLKGNKGFQVYQLPVGANRADIKSVVIWCEAFSVLFASATFE